MLRIVRFYLVIIFSQQKKIKQYSHINRLSGLSPFMGDSDVETFTNISCGEYDFEDEAFDAVSQDAKDFISNLLVRRKEKRLTAQQCLESKWLTDVSDSLSNVKICTDKLKTFVIRRKWQVIN